MSISRCNRKGKMRLIDSSDSEPEDSAILEEKLKQLLNPDKRSSNKPRNVFNNITMDIPKLRRSVVTRALQNYVCSTPMPSETQRDFFHTENSINISPISAKSQRLGDNRQDNEHQVDTKENNQRKMSNEQTSVHSPVIITISDLSSQQEDDKGSRGVNNNSIQTKCPYSTRKSDNNKMTQQGKENTPNKIESGKRRKSSDMPLHKNNSQNQKQENLNSEQVKLTTSNARRFSSKDNLTNRTRMDIKSSSKKLVSRNESESTIHNSIAKNGDCISMHTRSKPSSDISNGLTEKAADFNHQLQVNLSKGKLSKSPKVNEKEVPYLENMQASPDKVNKNKSFRKSNAYDANDGTSNIDPQRSVKVTRNGQKKNLKVIECHIGENDPAQISLRKISHKSNATNTGKNQLLSSRKLSFPQTDEDIEQENEAKLKENKKTITEIKPPPENHSKIPILRDRSKSRERHVNIFRSTSPELLRINECSGSAGQDNVVKQTKNVCTRPESPPVRPSRTKKKSKVMHVAEEVVGSNRKQNVESPETITNKSTSTNECLVKDVGTSPIHKDGPGTCIVQHACRTPQPLQKNASTSPFSSPKRRANIEVLNDVLLQGSTAIGKTLVGPDVGKDSIPAEVRQKKRETLNSIVKSLQLSKNNADSSSTSKHQTNFNGSVKVDHAANRKKQTHTKKHRTASSSRSAGRKFETDVKMAAARKAFARNLLNLLGQNQPDHPLINPRAATIPQLRQKPTETSPLSSRRQRETPLFQRQTEASPLISPSELEAQRRRIFAKKPEPPTPLIIPPPFYETEELRYRREAISANKRDDDSDSDPDVLFKEIEDEFYQSEMYRSAPDFEFPPDFTSSEEDDVSEDDHSHSRPWRVDDNLFPESRRSSCKLNFIRSEHFIKSTAADEIDIELSDDEAKLEETNTRKTDTRKTTLQRYSRSNLQRKKVPFIQIAKRPTSPSDSDVSLSDPIILEAIFGNGDGKIQEYFNEYDKQFTARAESRSPDININQKVAAKRTTNQFNQPNIIGRPERGVEGSYSRGNLHNNKEKSPHVNLSPTKRGNDKKRRLFSSPPHTSRPKSISGDFGTNEDNEERYVADEDCRSPITSVARPHSQGIDVRKNQRADLAVAFNACYKKLDSATRNLDPTNTNDSSFSSAHTSMSELAIRESPFENGHGHQERRHVADDDGKSSTTLAAKHPSNTQKNKCADKEAVASAKMIENMRRRSLVVVVDNIRELTNINETNSESTKTDNNEFTTEQAKRCSPRKKLKLRNGQQQNVYESENESEILGTPLEDSEIPQLQPNGVGTQTNTDILSDNREMSPPVRKTKTHESNSSSTQPNFKVPKVPAVRKAKKNPATETDDNVSSTTTDSNESGIRRSGRESKPPRRRLYGTIATTSQKEINYYNSIQPRTKDGNISSKLSTTKRNTTKEESENKRLTIRKGKSPKKGKHQIDTVSEEDNPTAEEPKNKRSVIKKGKSTKEGRGQTEEKPKDDNPVTKELRSEVSTTDEDNAPTVSKTKKGKKHHITVDVSNTADETSTGESHLTLKKSKMSNKPPPVSSKRNTRSSKTETNVKDCVSSTSHPIFQSENPQNLTNTSGVGSRESMDHFATDMSQCQIDNQLEEDNPTAEKSKNKRSVIKKGRPTIEGKGPLEEESEGDNQTTKELRSEILTDEVDDAPIVSKTKKGKKLLNKRTKCSPNPGPKRYTRSSKNETNERDCVSSSSHSIFQSENHRIDTNADLDNHVSDKPVRNDNDIDGVATELVAEHNTLSDNGCAGFSALDEVLEKDSTKRTTTNAHEDLAERIGKPQERFLERIKQMENKYTDAGADCSIAVVDFDKYFDKDTEEQQVTEAEKDSGRSSTLKSNTSDDTSLPQSKVLTGKISKKYKKTDKISKVLTRSCIHSKELEILSGHGSTDVDSSTGVQTPQPTPPPDNEYLTLFVDNRVVNMKYVERTANFKEMAGLVISDVLTNPKDGGGMGRLKIPPGCMKSLHIAKRYALFYFVTKGDALITVHNKSASLGSGGSFIIPLGVEYSIKNLSQHDTVELCFVKVPPRIKSK